MTTAQASADKMSVKQALARCACRYKPRTLQALFNHQDSCYIYGHYVPLTKRNREGGLKVI
jgi:hypothetical protein